VAGREREGCSNFLENGGGSTEYKPYVELEHRSTHLSRDTYRVGYHIIGRDGGTNLGLDVGDCFLYVITRRTFVPKIALPCGRRTLLQ